MENFFLKNEIKIICELHPQFYGSMDTLKRMVLQSKIGGASYVKLQLYDTMKIHGDKKRSYIEITEKDFYEINEYCKGIGIELTASVFNEDRIDWCEKINMKIYKIASRSVDNKALCEKIISTNKPTIISLGMYDWEKKGIPFENENIHYLYCISEYPTMLEKIKMPNFDESFFNGYSDHTLGINACIFAASKGAKIIEKHFSLNKSLQSSTQKAHVCSMDMNELSILKSFCEAIQLLNKNNA